jgi:hypothetical protein
METLSTLITSKPHRLISSSFKTIYWAILCIATFSFLFFLRYSPLVLWFAANAIVFSVYKLSSSSYPNHLSSQTDLAHLILASNSSDRWHEYPSTPAEPEPIEKEVTYVNTVADKDKKVMEEESMDDTWNAIMTRFSTATVSKRLLKKSDTWERSQQRLHSADEVLVHVI